MTKDQEIVAFCKEAYKVVKRSEELLNNISLPNKKVIDKKVLLNPVRNIYIHSISEDDYNLIKHNLASKTEINTYLVNRFGITLASAISYGKNKELRTEIKELIPYTEIHTRDGDKKSYHCYCIDKDKALSERFHILHEDVGSAMNCFISLFNEDFFIIYKA